MTARYRLAVPRSVVRELVRGLDAYARGEGGAGLRPSTVREARAIVRDGSVSLDKLLRWRAWHARHGASPAEVAARRRPSPARTAWLLWGGHAGAVWARAVLDALGV